MIRKIAGVGVTLSALWIAAAGLSTLVHELARPRRQSSCR